MITVKMSLILNIFICGRYVRRTQKKVLIASSLCQRAHVYVWDEPLNYVDVLSRMQIEELIAGYQPTMIFVEHDRVFCGNIATKTVVLDGAGPT